MNASKNAEDAVAEWEQIQAESGVNGWKDEFVTVAVWFPVIILFLAVFLAVLFGKPELANAAREAIKAVQELVPNYGELITWVSFAAIGVRALKSRV